MTSFIDIHTHTLKEDSKTTLSVYNLKNEDSIEKNKAYSAGIHPWDIKTQTTILPEQLTIYAQQKQVVAIGEIGLDRAIKTALKTQIEYFLLQHKMAEKHNKAIIIHCVKAYADFLGLHKMLKPTIPWIFHGFTANQDIADKLIGLGCYLSFGKHLLTSEKTQHVFKNTPSNHVFFETDDDDISIESVYEKATQLKPIALSDLKQQIQRNYNCIINT